MLNFVNQIKNNALELLMNWDKMSKPKLSKLEKLDFFILWLFRKIPQKKYEICWRRGLLAKAILGVADCENDYKSVLSFYQKYSKRKGEVWQLENIYNGEALLLLYIRYKDKVIENIIESYICYLKNRKKDKIGSIPYFNYNDDILVDGLMICPFIFMSQKYYRIDPELQKIGINQICNYIKYGLDERTGLPYHAYNYEEDLQKGIFGWGRGTGWFLSSISLSLEFLDKSDESYNSIVDAYLKIINITLSYQLSNGLYSWCILNSKGPIDTSATCMILFSLAKGINIGILPKNLISRVEKGYHSLEQYISNGRLYQAMADCGGLSVYPQDRYNNYPWSDGFYLLLSQELNTLK